MNPPIAWWLRQAAFQVLLFVGLELAFQAAGLVVALAVLVVGIMLLQLALYEILDPKAKRSP